MEVIIRESEIEKLKPTQLIILLSLIHLNREKKSKVFTSDIQQTAQKLFFQDISYSTFHNAISKERKGLLRYNLIESNKIGEQMYFRPKFKQIKSFLFASKRKEDEEITIGKLKRMIELACEVANNLSGQKTGLPKQQQRRIAEQIKTDLSILIEEGIFQNYLLSKNYTPDG